MPGKKTGTAVAGRPGAAPAVPPSRGRADAIAGAPLAAMLSAAGSGPVTEADLAAVAAAGCPTNADGTFNVVALGAWLLGGGRREG